MTSNIMNNKITENLWIIVIGTAGLILLSYLIGHMQESILRLLLAIGWSAFFMICCLIINRDIVENPNFFFGLILGTILALVISLMGGNLENVFNAKTISQISVADADKTEDAEIYYFKNGILNYNYQYSEIQEVDKSNHRRSNPLRHTYKVIPIVPENWNDTDSIKLWVCTEISYRESAIDKFPVKQWPVCHSGIDVLKFLKGKTNYFPTLVTDAAAYYHLNSSPYAKLIFVSASPANKLNSWGWIELFIIALFPIGVIIFKPLLSSHIFDTVPVAKKLNAHFERTGELFAGGLIVYTDEKGEHGLICSTKDLGEENWYNAKKLCANDRSGGYHDWRLPDKNELSLIYEHVHKKGIGNFSGSSSYWSSDSFSP